MISLSTDAAVLAKRAAERLQQAYTPPQRYGTAFHVTPPVRDVRELEVGAFATAPLIDDERSPAFFSPHLEPLLTQAAADPYLLWHLSQGSRLPITTMTVPAGTRQELTLPPPTGSHTSEVLVITLAAGASLTIYDIAAERDIALRHVHVVQQAGSTLTWWAVRRQLAFTHERMTVELAGSGARVQLIHLVAGQGADQYDGEIAVNHRVPDTQADVRLRTTVADTAVVLYRGRLSVGRAARGTQGYQQGRALMLSAKAVADLLPQLDIGTNDVRCSHGVSTLHLDDTALFYLRSRGLPEAAARRLAIVGFWHDQLEIPQSLREAVNHLGI